MDQELAFLSRFKGIYAHSDQLSSNVFEQCRVFHFCDDFLIDFSCLIGRQNFSLENLISNLHSEVANHGRRRYWKEIHRFKQSLGCVLKFLLDSHSCNSIFDFYMNIVSVHNKSAQIPFNRIRRNHNPV